MTSDVSEPLASDAAAPSVERESGRAWARWAPLAAGILLAAPALFFRYPPAADLSLHESLVSILRHFDDAQMFPPGLYVFNPGHPNQLFHFLAYALSFVVSTSASVKIVLAGAILGTGVGAQRFAKHIGASPWAAVAFTTVTSGWLLFIGLVANILGLALLLALAPTLDRYARSPSLSGAAKTIGSVFLLYAAHESAMFHYAVLGGIFALGHPFRARAFLARIAPSLVAFCISVLQLVVQARAIASAGRNLALPPVFVPPHLKIVGLPGVLLGPYDAWLSRAITYDLVLVVVLLAAQRWSEHRKSGERRAPGIPSFLFTYRFEIFGALCAFGYFAAPASLNGATYVYHRFLAPAFAMALLTASPRRTDGTLPKLFRATPLVAALAPLAMLITVLPAYDESSRNYDAVEHLLVQMKPGSAVASIHDAAPAWRTATSTRAIAERGGRMLYSFSESPIAPAMIRDRYDWPEPIDRVVPRGNDWCPSFDFTRFRYLFFNTSEPVRTVIVSQALAPEGRLVDVAGDWVLYESTLPVVPPTSPPSPLPAICATDTLGTRLIAAAVKAGVAPPEVHSEVRPR